MAGATGRFAPTPGNGENLPHSVNHFNCTGPSIAHHLFTQNLFTQTPKTKPKRIRIPAREED